MQIKLEDVSAVVVKQLLEVVYVLVALGPALLRHHVVHAHHQHIFVVGAVEDGNTTLARRGFVTTPKEIMGCFLLGRYLKARNCTTLRVHGAEHMIDCAILARRVTPLQADQQRALALGIHEVLQVVQLLIVSRDLC